jgi:hypothetical protein
VSDIRGEYGMAKPVIEIRDLDYSFQVRPGTGVGSTSTHTAPPAN